MILFNYRARVNSTSQEGIILQEINENNSGWKIQLSLDNEIIIKRITREEVTLLEKVNDEVVLFRLIRDINSNDLNTQIWASESLCYFIEEDGEKIDADILEKSISIMIDKLAQINQFESEQKLAEGIFEYLLLNKIDDIAKRDLLIRLAQLNKDCLHTYLNDVDYLKIKEVQEYVVRKENEWNTSR